MEALLEADKAFFIWLNSHHSPFWDVVMIWVSAKFSWVPLYALALWAIIAKRPKIWWLSILAVVLTIFLSDRITSGILKPATERLRPCWETELQNIIHTPEGCSGKFGFASSHAANSFAAAFLVLGLLKPFAKNGLYLKVSAYFWAFVVSYSRIYLGKHYPLDIIVGALIGITSAALVLQLFDWTQNRIKAKS